MSNKAIETAFIFAAGFGKRMAPLTNSFPKPLINIFGKPLIVHQLEKLEAADIKQVVINCHFMHEKLQNYLGNSFGAMTLLWSHELTLLDTGGGLLNALPLLGDAPFIVANADVYTCFDYRALTMPVHKSGATNSASTIKGCIVLVPNPEHNSAGDFSISEQGMLLSKQQGQNSYTYSGIAVFSADLIKRQANAARVFPLVDILKKGIQRQQIASQLYTGVWHDVGTPERLAQIEANTTPDEVNPR